MGEKRVGVFIDWQNLYRRARAAFHNGLGPSHLGQVDPLKLALHLASSAPGRRLVGVHIYRGQPSAGRDPIGYAANRRQEAAWKGLDRCIVVRQRPLRYVAGRADEKGIDVLLAVDFVRFLLIERRYDVGIVFSQDSDLAPAIELVCKTNTQVKCETACWKPDGAPAKRMRLQGVRKRIWTHFVGRSIYESMMDSTNYSAPSG